MPARLADGLRQGRPWARLAARLLLRALSRKPSAGWALRRGMLVHGVDSPLRYLDALREYTLAARAELIACPTWVCDAEGDDVGASAPRAGGRASLREGLRAFQAARGRRRIARPARALSTMRAHSAGWTACWSLPGREPAAPRELRIRTSAQCIASRDDNGITRKYASGRSARSGQMNVSSVTQSPAASAAYAAAAAAAPAAASAKTAGKAAPATASQAEAAVKVQISSAAHARASAQTARIQPSAVSASILQRADSDGDGRTGAAALDGDSTAQAAALEVKLSS